MTLRQADTLYELAATWTGENVVAEHDLVESFSAGVSRLLRGLGEELNDGYWAGVRRPLRALRWRLNTVPLRINSAAVGVRGTANVVIPRLRQCAAVAPERAPQAEALISLLDELATCTDNPLGDVVAGRLDYDDPVILLTDGHAAASVADSFPAARVMTATELLRGRAGNVVAVGASVWFPLRIQQAPRFKHLAFVRYSWIGDRVQGLGLLSGSPTQPHQGFEAGPVRPAREDQLPLAPEELVPVLEWGAISRKAREHTGENWGEPVEAQLFLLASRQGVYLEADEGARINVADVDAEIVVTQERIRRLTPGNFLVVRTSGDGDYVELYADQLLGVRAEHLRGIQNTIREKLHDHVEHLGLGATAEILRKHGSPRANEGNVRRWSEPGHIVTKDFADFAAICQLIGEPNAEGYFTAMKEIRSAHISAGQEVRKLLVQELRAADLRQLLREGWDDYDIEAVEGEGALRVARITGVAPESVLVPRGRLRKLFSIGDDLWLG